MTIDQFAVRRKQCNTAVVAVNIGMWGTFSVRRNKGKELQGRGDREGDGGGAVALEPEDV